LSVSRRIDVLNHGHVRLLEWMGNDLAVARAARVMPDAEWREGEGTGTDPGLLRFMMRHGHTSPFEQVVFKFEVKLPIASIRQWHRHRTQSPNEVSARYSVLPDEYYVPDIELIGEQSATNHQSRVIRPLTKAERTRNQVLLDCYVAHCDRAFRLYHDLLEGGWPRELARMCLPLSTYTRMIVTANLHNWFRFLHERLALGAQLEIRVYAEAILKLIDPVVPVCVAAWREGGAANG